MHTLWWSIFCQLLHLGDDQVELFILCARPRGSGGAPLPPRLSSVCWDIQNVQNSVQGDVGRLETHLPVSSSFHCKDQRTHQYAVTAGEPGSAGRRAWISVAPLRFSHGYEQSQNHVSLLVTRVVPTLDFTDVFQVSLQTSPWLLLASCV